MQLFCCGSAWMHKAHSAFMPPGLSLLGVAAVAGVLQLLLVSCNIQVCLAAHFHNIQKGHTDDKLQGVHFDCKVVSASFLMSLLLMRVFDWHLVSCIVLCLNSVCHSTTHCESYCTTCSGSSNVCLAALESMVSGLCVSVQCIRGVVTAF